MSKKLKLYNEYYEEPIHKSFLDEVKRYNELETNITINANVEISFLGILKKVSDEFSNCKDYLNIKIDDILINKHNNNEKFRVHKIDYSNMKICFSRLVDDHHKVWYGFELLKTINSNNTKFRYFEGYVSKTTNEGLGSVLSKKIYKRKLKEKALLLENEINRSLL